MVPYLAFIQFSFHFTQTQRKQRQQRKHHHAAIVLSHLVTLLLHNWKIFHPNLSPCSMQCFILTLKTWKGIQSLPHTNTWMLLYTQQAHTPTHINTCTSSPVACWKANRLCCQLRAFHQTKGWFFVTYTVTEICIQTFNWPFRLQQWVMLGKSRPMHWLTMPSYGIQRGTQTLLVYNLTSLYL